MSDTTSKDITWTPVLERYFKATAEKSEGLAWIHDQAEQLFNWRRVFIELPVIIGSGAIAFLNGASSSIFDDAKLSSVYLGIASFAVGTINTIGSYYGFAKRAEGHRIAALSYSKLNRFLAIEMSLPRDERMRPGDLLKMVKQEIDRLNETSPAVPLSIRSLYKSRFSTLPIAKPEISNGLHAVEIYDENAPFQRSESFAVPPTPIQVLSPEPAARQRAVHRAELPPPASSELSSLSPPPPETA